MHGPGFPQQPPQRPVNRPSDGTLAALRVLFVALPLLSCGFLAWTAPLKVAITDSRKRNWLVFAGFLVATALALTLVATDKTDDLSSPNGTLGMVIILSSAIAAVGWFLYADIAYYAKPAVAPWNPPPVPYPGPYDQTRPQAQPQPGYGYPGPDRTPVPGQGQPPVPGPAQPHRIDQVRAELDELSELLRREEGHGPGHGPEAGR
ncbi:hypothetical protein [Streptomyces sp. NPDC089919]|uniref:hypothetical protein n=1 Tax=Streptomyces sp. NPDC089919 TaxID=3155188 RepID=UPI00342E0208